MDEIYSVNCKHAVMIKVQSCLSRMVTVVIVDGQKSNLLLILDWPAYGSKEGNRFWRSMITSKSDANRDILINSDDDQFFYGTFSLRIFPTRSNPIATTITSEQCTMANRLQCRFLNGLKSQIFLSCKCVHSSQSRHLIPMLAWQALYVCCKIGKCGDEKKNQMTIGNC